MVLLSQKNKAYYEYLNYLEQVSIENEEEKKKNRNRNSIETDIGYQKSRPISMIITDPPRMRKGRTLNIEKFNELKTHFDNLNNSKPQEETDNTSESDEQNGLNESNNGGGLGSFAGTGGLGSFGGEGGSGGPRMSDV